jgi:hypothetical protein
MDNLTHKDSIGVATVGMDERMQNRLQVFFQTACKNRFVLAARESAKACIVDLDGYRGRELGNEYQKLYPGQPVIILSLKDTEDGDVIFLRKPIDPKELHSALSQVKNLLRNHNQNISARETVIPEAKVAVPKQPPAAQKVQQGKNGGGENDRSRPSTHGAAVLLGEENAKGLIGTAPDIDPADAEQVAKVQYDPNRFLQGYLYQAAMKADGSGKSVYLETPMGSIEIFPDHHGVALNISDSQVHTLSAFPLTKDNILLSTEGQSHELGIGNEGLLLSREALMWKAALRASRGRVPVGTDLNTPVFLRRWPNMTRLKLFPHAMRIAALWIYEPHSLVDTAAALAIPQRYVFAFYSAVHAIGLADISKRDVDTFFEATPIQKNKRRGLLGRIMRHLH